MYADTVNHFAEVARKKTDLLANSPSAFMIAALMAGAYVGIGIILIFTVGATIDPAWQKLVMGLSFGIALTLVVFAGSELFTGHTMYMTFGWLKKATNMKDLLKVWSASWVFNFVGAILLAFLFTAGGGGVLFADGAPLLHKIAAAKMNSGTIELLARGALCNWLVCLALWMAARTTNDSAKLIVIFWCLFAFIASGYEHSIANMTLLTLAVISEHPDSISVTGLVYNLFWVTLGNIVGGSVFMGFGYWKASALNAPSTNSKPIEES